MSVPRVGPFSTLRRRLGGSGDVVSQNRYLLRFLRVQTICPRPVVGLDTWLGCCVRARPHCPSHKRHKLAKVQVFAQPPSLEKSSFLAPPPSRRRGRTRRIRAFAGMSRAQTTSPVKLGARNKTILNPLMPSEFHVWHRERTPMRIESLRSSRPLPGFAPRLPMAPGVGYNPNSPPRFRERNDIFGDIAVRRQYWSPPLFSDAATPAAGKALPPFSREPPF